MIHSCICSVLESHKSLTLSEKIGREIELVEAEPSFQVVATMNPGGDFGKKELSPALMNRFTVIWAPSVRDEREMAAILEGNLPVRFRGVSRHMVVFWTFFAKPLKTVARHPLSIRDMLSWADFIANCVDIMTIAEAFWHGAHASIIDGLGLGLGLSEKVWKMNYDSSFILIMTASIIICRPTGYQGTARGGVPGVAEDIFDDRSRL